MIRLVADIKARWAIPDSRILAHSDIAPGRKVDPGERFPWARLAAEGLGLWPTAVATPDNGPTYRLGDEGLRWQPCRPCSSGSVTASKSPASMTSGWWMW